MEEEMIPEYPQTPMEVVSPLEIGDFLSILGKKYPETKEFKKKYIVTSKGQANKLRTYFAKDAITKADIFDPSGDKRESASFRIVKKDFICIYESFPLNSIGIMFIFYNDEDIIKREIIDKVFNEMYLPGTYNLQRSMGVYFLEKTSVSLEDKPELESNIFEDVNKDISYFFGNEKFYKENNLQYRRGILLYGPPGNGKSSIIKQILDLHKDKYGIIVDCAKVIESGLGKFIDEISKNKPKLIVMEDIDSVSDYDRSLLLNFLDGVDSPEKMFIIATTNHLHKLDPAIKDRPGRFDKVYHFGLPDMATRARIIKKYFKGLDDKTIEEASRDSDGFSGAYIKEMFIQSGVQGVDILQTIKNIKKQMETYKTTGKNSYLT